MSQESISSVGQPGIDHNRSFGRSYENVEQIVDRRVVLAGAISGLFLEANSRNRRRVVLKAQISQNCWDKLAGAHYGKDMPTEALIPLKMINPQSEGAIVYLGRNMYPTAVPEWPEIYRDWSEYHRPRISPLEQVAGTSQRFDLISRYQESDYNDLQEIWRPFGWNRKGIDELLQDRLNGSEQVWFSGIVDRSSNRLVSACMAEMGQIGETTLVETTEYGTLPEYTGQKLCTTAISFINAQILRDLYYSDPSEANRRLPLIYAELSMTSRSDLAARNAGYDIPLRERFYFNKPMQVLRHNVAVFDNLPPNNLNLEEIDPRLHQAMGSDYPYYRNFIPGVLPYASVRQYYSEPQTMAILEYEGRNR